MLTHALQGIMDDVGQLTVEDNVGLDGDRTSYVHKG